MISAILLAAGQSKRMIKENKLLKKFNNMCLLQHSIKNILLSAVDELIIVLGHEKENVEKIIEKNKKIRIIYNKYYKSGMSSSIKAGLNNLSKNTNYFFICLGDMPFVNKDIYNKIISLKKKRDIIIPTYKGKQSNPVLFSNLMIKNIMKIDGAKKIFKLNEKKILNIEIDNINITKDFNSTEDFNF